MTTMHLELLRHYTQTQDAGAFASLVDAYRDLVYSVCLRMLGNRADAEDATQECFLALARKAGQVRSSVAGWLHARATALCLNRIERDRNRQLREQEYSRQRCEEGGEATWEQIGPEVDQALAELPEELREVLIAHFLQRKQQVAIAEELGTSAPTVCRRVNAGIEALRSKLADRGVLTSSAVLGPILLEHGLIDAPQTLVASLGKLAMAGIGGGAARRRWPVAAVAVAGALVIAGGLAAVQIARHLGPAMTVTDGAATSTRSRTVDTASGKLVADLRPMVTWNLGQNYQINGYLQFQMERLGEGRDYDYWFFAGVGGDAHTQVFTRDTSRSCHSLSQIDFGPEFARTLYDAVGYDVAWVSETQFNADRARYVAELAGYIDRGVPIIARQSDKAQEFSLLVGYEDAGKQLLFVEGDSTQPYRVSTSAPVRFGFILPGAKKQAPALADVYRRAVLDIPSLLMRPAKGDVYFGRQAFEAWADHLVAENYQGWTDEQLDLWRLHTTYVCIVSTNGSCRTFLQRAAALCPDLRFVPEVEQVYAKMERIWKSELEASGGSFNIAKETLRNKEAKKRIAEVIRQYSACCDEILAIYKANGYAPEAPPAKAEGI